MSSWKTMVMPMNTTHPTDEALEQYALGQLPDSEAASVEEHLLICTACQDRLREADEYVAAIRAALNDLPVEGRREADERPSLVSRFVSSPKSALAGVLAAIGLLVIAQPWSHNSNDPFELDLATYRGTVETTAAPAGQPLVLNLDLTGLRGAEAYQAEVADASGTTLHQADLRPDRGAATLRVNRSLDPGQYWVRIYGTAAGSQSRRELFREFSLPVR